MRFKQNERKAALKALRVLIHANQKSIDERAGTICDHLYRWRKTWSKSKKSIVIPEIKPIAEEIEILLTQNKVLEGIHFDLENLIGTDLEEKAP